MSRVHVFGAGMAGLSAALAIADAGRPVTLYEAGPAAGGRCRSYHDKELGCRLDNGNHLWLSGNRAIAGFLRRVGSEAAKAGPPDAQFPFMDLRSGARWTVRPNAGRLPWWLFARSRRVPDSRLAEWRGLVALLRAAPDSTVDACLRPGPLRERLLDPLVIAALNTAPARGSAQLMAAVVRETLAQGGAACIPAFPREGLSATFVDPALEALRRLGVELRFGTRANALAVSGGRVSQVETTAGPVAIGAGEAAILAVPAPVAQSLLPGLSAPEEFEAIVNVHYAATARAGAAGFIGLLGGLAEWVFVKPHVVSVTISAANHLVDRPARDLAATVWPEVCAALRLEQPTPPWRVVKERRATFAATPAQTRKRPGPRVGLDNLALAGDWTDTGLPSTIEGALRSGKTAAAAILRAA